MNLISIKDVKGYKKNARIHSEKQVGQIAESIKMFGFNSPVLIDEKNELIAGHGRIAAARKLGIVEVPCVKITHLSSEQKKAYRLIDNQIALNSTWDNDFLETEIEQLNEFDLDLSSFGLELKLTHVDVQELDANAANVSELEEYEKNLPSAEAKGKVTFPVILTFSSSQYKAWKQRSKSMNLNDTELALELMK